jgi:hypothetical protein
MGRTRIRTVIGEAIKITFDDRRLYIMTKKQFVDRINLIQKFHIEQYILNSLINKITDGYSIVTIGNSIVQEIIVMIEEDMDCKDILDWWLYEDVDKVLYYKDKEISVRTLDELYDYIIEYR